ncbi:acyl-CoA--6-aminopenicillanic acid acyl-transferase [Sphingobacterium shayense]|uniref:C45 family peptidase n=1 Tax=Sphingobacterium shayense TaxID=626343 RepID=UPI0015559FC9|nr:C45 family peptidase [Sphingobacterium shayense]NQD69212.1 acyl-CoA--6-aminopenicillanic acid acyl-transferase [Sphingobacterium shayense]
MLRYSILFIISLMLLSSCKLSRMRAELDPGSVVQPQMDLLVLKSDSLMFSGDDYMVKNELANWELYVQGSPEVIGAKIGLLSKDLYRNQENIFAEKLLELVPSKRKQKRIMSFLNWYTRKLDDYIPKEYLKEIYALSKFLDTTYNYLGSPYQRTLWMHGAHDIGHVLQDLAMVGCSSFAFWGENTQDGNLLIGRNLDFYMNDDFAKQKILYFVKPLSGHPYMSVSWPGMMGVLSGMNREGLTITLNAGKSSIPWSAKTPISIVAREVLQYAANIEEALRILEKKKVFVSETLMIGSAQDKKAILVEITPRKIDVVNSVDNRLLSTNHFQGKLLGNDKRNTKHIARSHSMYRFQKLQMLLDTTRDLTPEKAISIMRNKDGHQGEKLGLGNEKSLNHLLAHHGVVFQPEDRLVYVSSAPGQMGAYKAYDLKAVFDRTWQAGAERSVDSLLIPADTFIGTREYFNFKSFQRLTQYYLEKIYRNDILVVDSQLQEYIDLNPDLWLGYYIVAQIYYLQGDYPKAEQYFRSAACKVLPTAQVKIDIQKHLKKVSKRWKKTQ